MPFDRIAQYYGWVACLYRGVWRGEWYRTHQPQEAYLTYGKKYLPTSPIFEPKKISWRHPTISLATHLQHRSSSHWLCPVELSQHNGVGDKKGVNMTISVQLLRANISIHTSRWWHYGANLNGQSWVTLSLLVVDFKSRMFFTIHS